jgi:acyl-CoA thioester hydrolase
MTLDEFRKQYPFTLDDVVQWGDMDAFQHVNNTIYFKYFERARIYCLDKIGIIDYMRRFKRGPILASTSCRFKSPLTYPDKLVLGTGVFDLEADRFKMSYAVYSIGLQRVAAEGDGVTVWFDYDKGQKAEIPEQVRVLLARAASGIP